MKIRFYTTFLICLTFALSSCSTYKSRHSAKHAVATKISTLHKPKESIKAIPKAKPHNLIPKTKPIKILPLGDSITCASTQKLSYRYPLWKQLVDAGKQVEFIGSQLQKGNGYRSWTPYKGKAFPKKNEAHSGWRTDQILNGLESGEVGLDHWIKSYTPDIALIHLGTNDLYQAQSPESTRDEIEQVIQKLRGKNPHIKIALARIIPMRSDPNVPRFNQLLAQLAQKLNRPYSPVISVDMYSGFNIQTNMQIDHIHPNASGEEILANRWFNVLMRKEFLGDR